MGLFYKANKGHLIDFTLELKGEWYNEIREETRSRFLAPEWYAQSGVEIVWPTEETDWAYMLDEVTEVYIRMTYEIASRERLLIVTSAPEKIGVILKRHMPAKALDNITIAESEINDTWARDTGFLTVLGPNGAELMDFKFNGWGNKFEASKDNAINRNLFGNNYFKGTYTDCNNYVLEGGSIEVDAQGSLRLYLISLVQPFAASRKLSLTSIVMSSPCFCAACAVPLPPPNPEKISLKISENPPKPPNPENPPPENPPAPACMPG